MPSRADLDQFVKAQRAVRAMAQRDLRAWWATLATTSPIEIKVALSDFLPLLIDAHGETSATVAADYYDLCRDQSTAKSTRRSFAARMAGPIDRALISRLQYDALGPLFRETPDMAQTLSNLEGVVDSLSLQQGRNTIAESAAKDPAKPRWARVPVGKTCSWCVMLASRGAVYRSVESAGEAAHYHDQCDCQPTPSWEGDHDLPYDPAPHYEQYTEARVAAIAEKGRNITQSDITAKMRELFDLK